MTNTHQQSLADASSENRPPMLEKGIANTYASSSSSRSPPAYYVTHTPLVIGYDDDYQGDAIGDDQEDSLTTAMMLLAREITQRYYTPTNNHLRTSSNTRNQTIIQANHEDIQSKNVRSSGQYVRRTTGNQGDVVRNVNVERHTRNVMNVQRILRTTANFRMVQMFNVITAMPKVEDFEYLNAIVCMMARIQKEDNEVPNLSMSFINELYSKNDHEQKYHKQQEIIKTIIDDDQINSDIIFDDPNVELNNGQVKQDNNDHDQDMLKLNR
ncbi:hypothetical protein Tco_0774474 [Tanacetum coccineum]|uniref:Uncharacterized protein n=1 Tax=Tanacetum coccineum TaxID=301880 RepID=A0ABQ4ZSW5_9ASTR